MFDTIWDRFKNDYKYGMFIKHPYEFKLFEKDLDFFKANSFSKIENNKYIPQPAFYCNVPKRGGLIRPGSYLTLQDFFYYLYLITVAYDNICKTIKWSQESIDLAYSLTGNNSKNHWIKNRFKCWESYRLKSIDFLNKNYPYVIVTDITGFYENIDHSILYSELINSGVSNNISIQIKNCLKKWSLVPGKGIPQACSASHILAKLYLHSTDLALRDFGCNHLRYVDDIRIFCKSKLQAKKVLMKLVELTRTKGLNLQSAKTKIIMAEEARSQIESIQLTIENIANKITKEKPELIATESPSLDFESYNQIRFEISSENLEILQKTFSAYFLEASDKEFDKTLFHYLLNRLADFKSDFALDYCFSIFEKHPEETEFILNYCQKIDEVTKTVISISEFVCSDLAIYYYQNYLLIKWINDNYTGILPEDLHGFIRKQINTISDEWYYKSELKRALSLFGNVADIEYLLNDYQHCRSDLEKAEAMFNLLKLEKSKRNAFYARTNKDCRLVEIAQLMIK